MNYVFHIMIFINIYIIVALSLNLMAGYSGLMTLAHAAFFAIGAYVYSVLSLAFGWHFFPAILVSISVTGIFSLLLSIPAWRFRGDYFLLLSLAVQFLIYSLIYNWADSNEPLGSISNLTNGPFGISGIPKLDILGINFDTPYSIFVISFIIMLVCAWITWQLVRSPWGRLLKSMRDDELALKSLGKSTRKAKIQVTTISSFLVAVAGIIYAFYIGYLDPAIGSLDHSILIFSMIIIGGLGNFRGPIVGAIILVLIPELLRLTPISTPLAANLRLLAYGLSLLLVVHFRPQGIAGLYRVE